MSTAPLPQHAQTIVAPTRQLLRDGCFIDLRAPVEFARGALPGASNLPLMNDAEREQVGTAYARQGQQAAIALGHELVSGATRRARVASWQRFVAEHPEAMLYCARGGLRSQTVQTWLRDEGLAVPRVAGGFKALRQLCLTVLERAPTEKPILVVGGRTGCAKTALLPRLPGSIDLEGLANHRSSAFGERDTPQPPQIGFENALAVAYLRHTHDTLVLEDESRSIGHVALPNVWYEAMRRARLIVIESDMAQRCQRIAREYVHEPIERGASPRSVHERLAGAASRIQRKLGAQRHAQVMRLLAQGFEHGDHTPWIERLLEWYYDPAYDRGLARKHGQIIWRGGVDEAPDVVADIVR